MMLRAIFHRIGFISMLSYVYAGFSASLPITLTFDGGNTAIQSGTSGTAYYLAQVNAAVRPSGFPLTLSLVLNSLPSWVSQHTTGTSQCNTQPTNICGSTMSLVAGERCCLELDLHTESLALGGYSLAPRIATTPAVYQAKAAETTVAITETLITVPSRFTIAYANAGDAGATGSLTVTNVGDVAARNVQVNLAGLTCNSGAISQTPCTAAAHSTCNITFTATAPTTCLASGGVIVIGENTNPAVTAVAFSIGGYYVFALNNLPTSNEPQVLDAADLASAQWGNQVQTNAQSLTNGYINTVAINGTAGIGTSAAVNCYNSQNGNVGVGTWYLPAVCQMGGSHQGAGCTNANNTTLDGLTELGFVSLASFYWSSTERAGLFSQGFAWLEDFSIVGDGGQAPDVKYNVFPVRCTRAITP